MSTYKAHLLEKLEKSKAAAYPGLSEAINLLVRILEANSANQIKDPLPIWLAEVVVAAGYLLNRYDVVPDDIPEIGLADDAIILNRVIERNRSQIGSSIAAISNARDCE